MSRVVASLTAGIVLVCDVGAGQNWPQWRGPLGTGSLPGSNPPVAWSESSNIAWKVAIPGTGNASPVVWADWVFVLTAVETDRKLEQKTDPDEESLADWQRKMRTKPVAVMRYVAMALGSQDGKVLWESTAAEGAPHEPRHKDASWASASPVTDGEFVFAHFGSRGLYAYDMNGVLKWKRNFGEAQIRNGFGEGSSPTVQGDLVIVVWDHQGGSFITALDRKTGGERWKTDRDEITAWATPIVAPVKDGMQILTSATGKIRSYDLGTGALLWECRGMTTNAIPTPAVANGMAYFASGFRGSALLAVRLCDASGDITGGPAVAWTCDKNTPYVPSPLLHEGRLYMTGVNEALLTCLDAATGSVCYGPEKLDGLKGVYASLVGAGDRVYITGRNGATAVVRAGEKFGVLSVNALDDSFTASAALTGDALFLRGQKFLYCIREKR